MPTRTEPYYQDSTVTLHHGDSLDVLRTLAAGSVDCAVTSPPYYGLRDYGHPGQIGAESSPAEYVERLRVLFAEVRRVLANDGTLWLNLGDSYASKSKGSGGLGSSTLGRRSDGTMSLSPEGVLRAQERQHHQPFVIDPGMPDKNLLGIPWRVAFALQDDSWVLRNAIIWSKPNAMPESVTDRLSTRYEMLFMFSKSRRYWFDLDAIREPQAESSIARLSRNDWRGKDGWDDAYHGNPPRGLMNQKGRDATIGRNPGDVWEIATTQFSGGHFAVFPPELPRRCIVAGCKPGGVVLDPFHGSGTTGMVAVRNGRKYVGIELNRDYLDLSLRTRLADGTLDFDGETA